MPPHNWYKKQSEFSQFLIDHGAEKASYRVDLEKCLVYWVDDQELSLAVADCKVILSYALSNRSVMMGWANYSLPEGSGIDEIEGFQDIYTDCEEKNVWALTTAAAEEVDAEAIYRTPSPQWWVMLALWNIRPGGAEQFISGSPRDHVLRIVENLIRHPDLDERQILIDNYAESFIQMANHPYRATPFEPALKDTARDFRNLLALQKKESQDEELLKVHQTWLDIS